MKMWKTAFAFVALLAINLPTAHADQPNMREALRHLREARAELARAERNKAGHREKAIDLVDQAIAEVQAGIDAGR